jgi:DNA-binding NarL/FixJ family response regulator
LRKITVPAKLARCTREGLHIEFGVAAERLAGLCERAGERPFEVYREPLKRQDEARALLQEIGGKTPNPPASVEIDPAHRSILLRTLEEQRRSYVERLDELNDDEQRAANERVQELDVLICTVEGEHTLALQPDSQQREPDGSGAAILTQREREVLNAIRCGRSYGEIAAELGVGIETVRTHAARVRRKLGVSRKAELLDRHEPIERKR